MFFFLSLLLVLLDSRYLSQDEYLPMECRKYPSLITDYTNLKQLSAANNQFDFKLQKSLCGNVIWSPLSVFTGMGMLYIGARGVTAREIRHALSYDAVGLKCDVMNQQFKHLLHSYVYEEEQGGLQLANVIISQKNYSVLSEYKDNLEYYFRAAIKEVDFRQPKESVDEVNKWISDQTRGEIPKLLQSLENNTVLFLLNAVHFKGVWKAPFDDYFTRDGEFYNNGNIAINVRTMVQSSRLLHGKFPEYSLSALKLPYRGGRFSMVVLLPFERNGLWKVEEKISLNTLESIIAGLKEEFVLVKLPKFKLENRWELKKHFQELGVITTFTDLANLSGISSRQKLKVSKIIHQAMIEVNETGTGASAATAIVLSPRTLSEDFFVEHPFLFFIMDDTAGMIIFSGRIVEL